MTTALSPFADMDDSIEFGKLPDALKLDVLTWRTVMERIEAAPRAATEIAAIAREYAGRAGFSEKSIERKYYQVKGGAGWRALVNRNRLTGRRTDGMLTAAVKREWHATVAKYQRKFRPAYRDLCRRYRAGETIGDINWTSVWKEDHPHMPVPASCPPDMPLPVGWSYDSFMRNRPKRADVVAIRIGEKAAAEYRYQVHSTRKGMHVGEAYVFDDMWHDLKLNFVGQTASVRPLELGGADVFSGYKLDPGFRPRRERADGTNEGLAEADMRFYLAHVLCNLGIYRGGCTLYVEHGTAAIPKALDPLLKEFGITVQRSGIEGVKQYAQLYSGKGGGNPRLKAGYESLHNLVHNELAALPAQTGMDRNHQPESLYGRDAINTKLLIASYALTPQRASLLRFPVMEWNTGIEAIMAAYYNMNRRVDHELEGWVAAGLVKHQFRLGPMDGWRDCRELDALDPEKRAAVEAIITLDDYHQVVRASPWDVWSAGQADLVKLPMHLLPTIVGSDLGILRPCPPSDQVEFRDQTVGSEPMYFETRVTTPQGWQQSLQEGATYRWLINPFDSRQLFVCQANGAYVGMARRCDVPCKTDADGLHREMGIAAAHEKAAAQRLITMNRDEIKRRIDTAVHNTAVLRGDAITDDERRLASQIQDQSVSAADVAAATDFAEQPRPEQFSAEEVSALLRD